MSADLMGGDLLGRPVRRHPDAVDHHRAQLSHTRMAADRQLRAYVYPDVARMTRLDAGAHVANPEGLMAPSPENTDAS